MFEIDPSIERASTLPPHFYHDPQVWEEAREKIFTQEWQFLGDRDQFFQGTENVIPVWLLENYLDEPLLLVEEGEQLRCLTNVCTHRGFMLARHPARMNRIVCQYHGRRFGLDGKFQAMPEFEEAENFPRPCDHLHQLPLEQWHQFLFTRVAEGIPFAKIRDRLNERLYHLDLSQFVFQPAYSKTYNIQSHWALYCDNYLEGFHIPFVHQGLRGILDYGSYSTETYDQMVLQIGYSNGKSQTLDLPEGHPDADKEVTAYYYWIFPNLMLNFYPWGLQLNLVRPINPNFTKVDFLYYIQDEETFEVMNGLGLSDKTEREDEFVVEAVHRGLKSRFYQSGRFSPKREKGVHYFHQLLAASMQKG